MDYKNLANKGRFGDNRIRKVDNRPVHVNSYEAYLLDTLPKQKAQNIVKNIGAGTINPRTGLKEYHGSPANPWKTPMGHPMHHNNPFEGVGEQIVTGFKDLVSGTVEGAIDKIGDVSSGLYDTTIGNEALHNIPGSLKEGVGNFGESLGQGFKNTIDITDDIWNYTVGKYGVGNLIEEGWNRTIGKHGIGKGIKWVGGKFGDLFGGGGSSGPSEEIIGESKNILESGFANLISQGDRALGVGGLIDEQYGLEEEGLRGAYDKDMWGVSDRYSTSKSQFESLKGRTGYATSGTVDAMREADFDRKRRSAYNISKRLGLGLSETSFQEDRERFDIINQLKLQKNQLLMNYLTAAEEGYKGDAVDDFDDWISQYGENV